MSTLPQVDEKYGRSIRLAMDCWEAGSIAAKKRRCSLQQLVAEAVRNYLGLPAPASADTDESQNQDSAA